MDIWGIVWIILSIVFTIAFLALYVISLVWVWRDAEARGKSGPLIAFLGFLSWPWGLMLWYVFRPKETRFGRPLQ